MPKSYFAGGWRGAGVPVQYNVAWGHTSVPAKWHVIPSNGLLRMNDCDRQTDHATVTSVAIASTDDAFSHAI